MKILDGRELQDTLRSLLQEAMEKIGLEGEVVTFDESSADGYAHVPSGYGLFVDTEDGVWGVRLHRECLRDGRQTSNVVYKIGNTVHLDPERVGIRKEEGE